MPSPQQLLSSAGQVIHTLNRRLNTLFLLYSAYFLLFALPLSAPSAATFTSSNSSSSQSWSHWSMSREGGKEVCPSARAWVTHPGSFCTTLWHSPYLSNQTELERREERAVQSYCEVDRILERFDCSQEFSVNVKRGQCKLCRQAYREWACAMVTDTLEDGQVDCFTKLMPCPSCASICHQVMRLCPYLSPDRMQFDLLGHNLPAVSQYGGHPAFYCPLENDDPSDPAYTSLCYDSSSYSSNDPDYVHNICTNPPIHSRTRRILRRRSSSNNNNDQDFAYEDNTQLHHDNYSDWTPPPHYTTCCWTYASSVVTFLSTQPFPRYGSDTYFNSTEQKPPKASNFSENLVILNCCDSNGACHSQHDEVKGTTEQSPSLLPSSSIHPNRTKKSEHEESIPEKPPLFKTRKRSSEDILFSSSSSSSEEIDIDTSTPSGKGEEDVLVEEEIYKTIQEEEEGPSTHNSPHLLIDSYDEHYVDTEPEPEGGSSSTELDEEPEDLEVIGIDKFFDKLWTPDEFLKSTSASAIISSTPPPPSSSRETGSKDNNNNLKASSASSSISISSVHSKDVSYQENVQENKKKNQFMAIVIGVDGERGDGVERHHPLRTRRTKDEFNGETLKYMEEPPSEFLSSSATRLQLSPATCLISVFNIVTTFLLLSCLCYLEEALLWSFNFLPEEEEEDHNSKAFKSRRKSRRKSVESGVIEKNFKQTTLNSRSIEYYYYYYYYCSHCKFKVKLCRNRKEKYKYSRTTRRKCKWKWRFRFRRSRDDKIIKIIIKSRGWNFQDNFQNNRDNSAFTVQSLLKYDRDKIINNNCLERIFERHKNDQSSFLNYGLRFTSDDNNKLFRSTRSKELASVVVIFCIIVQKRFQIGFKKLPQRTPRPIKYIILLSFEFSPGEKESCITIIILMDINKLISCLSCHTNSVTHHHHVLLLQFKICPEKQNSKSGNFGCEFLNFRLLTKFLKNLRVIATIKLIRGGQSNYSTISLQSMRRRRRRRRKVRMRSLIEDRMSSKRNVGGGDEGGALGQGRFRLYLFLV